MILGTTCFTFIGFHWSIPSQLAEFIRNMAVNNSTEDVRDVSFRTSVVETLEIGRVDLMIVRITDPYFIFRKSENAG